VTAVDDLILISVDDHLIEPPDLFAGHLAAKYLDVPKGEATVRALRRRAAGHDVSIMSRSTRVLSPDEKLAQFRGRAERAAAAAAS
jgi:hypothetical protein